MKLTINVLTGFAISLLLASCSKDYLTKVPANALPQTEAIQTEADLLTVTSGIYSGLRATDLYWRTLPLKGDIMADNAFVTTSNSNRYISFNNFNFTTADAYATNIWTNAYVVIKNANNAINAAVPASVNADQYKGEAYAIRALMYFELVRNYARPFTLAPNDPGVPVVTTFNYEEKPARSSVKDVYTQILSDLNKAYSLMTMYRGSAYFSKYGARALEAKVYQTMGDWEKAKMAALDVVTKGGFTLTSSSGYVAYWNNASVRSDKIETIFEVASDVANNNAFDQIGYIYLTKGGGYGDILATKQLYDLFAPTDVRKQLILDSTRRGQAGRAYLNIKYSNAAGSGDKDDTKVLRFSDVVLILAEAYYNTGERANALKYLNQVAQQRDPSFAGYTSSTEQLLEDILTERRKELAFEGDRLWDLVRLGRSWTKISNENPYRKIDVTADNKYLIFPIPQVELDANPSVTQNPGY